MKTGGKRCVTYDIEFDDGRTQPVQTTFIVSDSMKVVFSARMLEEQPRDQARRRAGQELADPPQRQRDRG
eukprot:1130700-Heterocapsa_arctica.AAC.1